MENFFENWDLILSIMLDNCNKEFYKTKEAEYMREKYERMEENCKIMLASDDIPFAQECFSILCRLKVQRLNTHINRDIRTVSAF